MRGLLGVLCLLLLLSSVFGLNAGKLDAKVLCIDGDCRLVWPSGSGTDTTLDSNVDASASWLSKGHDWNADQNFSKVNVVDLNLGNSGFIVVGDKNYSFVDLNLSVINVCSGDVNSFLNSVGECISISDFNSGSVDLSAYYKQVDLNALIQVSDFNRVWVSQLDGNLWYVKVLDSNNVGRLISDVVADWNVGVQFAFGYDLNELVQVDVNNWIDVKISGLTFTDTTLDDNSVAEASWLSKSRLFVGLQRFLKANFWDLNVGSGNVGFNDLNYSLIDLNKNVFNMGISDCGANQYVYGFNVDETLKCRVDQSGSGGGSYIGVNDVNVDNDLNTVGLNDDFNVSRDARYLTRADQNNTGNFPFLVIADRLFSLLSLDDNSSFDDRYAKILDVNASLLEKLNIVDRNSVGSLVASAVNFNSAILWGLLSVSSFDVNVGNSYIQSNDLNYAFVDLNYSVQSQCNGDVNSVLTSTGACQDITGFDSGGSFSDTTVDSNVTARSSFLGQTWSWVKQVFGSIQTYDLNVGSGFVQSNDLNYAFVDLNYSVQSQCNGDVNSVLTSVGTCQDISGYGVSTATTDTTLDSNVSADSSYRNKSHVWSLDQNFNRINVFDLNAVGYNNSGDLNLFFARRFVSPLHELLYSQDFNSAIRDNNSVSRYSFQVIALPPWVTENVFTQGLISKDANSFNEDVNVGGNNIINVVDLNLSGVVQAGDNDLNVALNPDSNIVWKYQNGAVVYCMRVMSDGNLHTAQGSGCS